MKIGIVVGTRPEIIKMSSVVDEIIKNNNHELVFIHTGQHYNKELSENFFKDLKLPKPDYNIHVGSGSHAKQTSLMMEGIEEILLKENPDILLVQGDTNAVLAGVLVASKLHVSIGHIEAGLRSYDFTMPEEINRCVADVCSTLYFVPTEKSAINLLMENISRKKIFITGNTVVDVCSRNLELSKNRFNKKQDIYIRDINLSKLNNIICLTMHRAETVDNKKHLQDIVEALGELNNVNVVFPIHPRTEKMLKKFELYNKLANLSHVHIIPPVGYLDFLLLMSKSSLILTDSGGLQEEAITLNIPSLTLRYNTERPETVIAGGNILVGYDKQTILKNIQKILGDDEFANTMKSAKNPYGDGTAANQILNIIESNYNKNKLTIKSPEKVKNTFINKFLTITEDITVNDFEQENNVLIKLVFNDETVKFPYDNLNLKNFSIQYEKYLL